MEENEVVQEVGSTEQAPDAAPSGDGAEPTAQELLDLDSVEKFKFGGREWTPKDFQGAYMMQSDYTKKTQAIAEERKFYDNLSFDLAAVKANPMLSEKFKSVYPEKFHSYLGYVTPQQAAQAKQAEQAQSGWTPEQEARFSRMESAYKEREVAAAEAQIDATFGKLSQKYPMVDEESAIARGQALLDKGQKLNEATWDGIFKSIHDKYQALADKAYSAKVKQQTQANSRGKDVAQGGGIPGQAPKMPRTIKEATSFAMQEIENS